MSSETLKAEKRSKKYKDGEEKKSSKKRKHEEPDTENQPAEPNQSPVKKQRKEKKDKKETKKQSVSEAEKVDPSATAPNATASQQSDAPEKISKPHQPTATKGTIDESQLHTNSPFVKKTASLYLPLSPIAFNSPLKGLCAEHISPLLLTYYAPLKGVILSYSNPRLSEHPSQGAHNASSSSATETVLSRSVDEYAVTYTWLTAEFTMFKPSRGRVLEGYVNLQNEGILGLMCYNYFNAGIDRNRLPSDWAWISNEGGDVGTKRRKPKANAPGDGYFVDGSGNKVEGKILFRVRDFDASIQSETGAGTINILGTLLSPDEDQKLDATENNRPQKGTKA